jgi:hypothetical protein
LPDSPVAGIGSWICGTVQLAKRVLVFVPVAHDLDHELEELIPDLGSSSVTARSLPSSGMWRRKRLRSSPVLNAGLQGTAMMEPSLFDGTSCLHNGDVRPLGAERRRARVRLGGSRHEG